MKGPQPIIESRGNPVRFEFIDALRGYAIIMVVLVHAGNAAQPSSETLKTLIAGGAKGVQLFYVLSAFTLCHSWTVRSQCEINPTANFFIRRIFRVGPLFWTAILFYSIQNGSGPSFWAPNGIRWWFIPLTALFLHGSHPETINSVVPGGWSVGVEMTFYCILPFLMRTVNSIFSSTLFIIVSLATLHASKCLLSIFQIHIQPYPEEHAYLFQSFTSMNFFAQLYSFSIGCCCYFISQSRFLKPIAFLGLGFVSLRGVNLLISGGVEKIISRDVFCALGFGSMLLWLQLYPLRFLGNVAIQFIGRISYPMYLCHFAVISLFVKFDIFNFIGKGDAASLYLFFIVLSTSLPVSALVHRLIELPGICLGKRLVAMMEGRSSAKAQLDLASHRVQL